jgi:hypothetical protein
MKALKKLFSGFIIGAMVGLWCGVNIGKGQPVYSNPFKTKSIANKIIESSGDALEKSGRALKEKIQK